MFQLIELVRGKPINPKYEGYIQKQLKQVEQMRKLETKLLPKDFDYREIKGLRLEAQEKPNKIKLFRRFSVVQLLQCAHDFG